MQGWVKTTPEEMRENSDFWDVIERMAYLKPGGTINSFPTMHLSCDLS